MKEIDPLEKQLQSWTPRRPSAKIEQRLFPRERSARLLPAHVWQWLTPFAACALTFLVALSGPSLHTVDVVSLNPSPVAAVMYDPQSPNMLHSFVLSRADVNVQQNSWDRAYPSSLN